MKIHYLQLHFNNVQKYLLKCYFASHVVLLRTQLLMYTALLMWTVGVPWDRNGWIYLQSFYVQHSFILITKTPWLSHFNNLVFKNLLSLHPCHSYLSTLSASIPFLLLFSFLWLSHTSFQWGLLFQLSRSSFMFTALTLPLHASSGQQTMSHETRVITPEFTFPSDTIQINPH